ncbi:hypothetical protein ACFSKI_13825 [Pseudogracilibacillus auburnensis]|uniref:Uncharacterized protein n=1 Tax=Pseudogracilibacillus auburnensis TaxID=1494959 RepID=A0A2V3WAK0_9BACI|nr:hypothetical protein [Pseudogracilibacillus auburnensis]MBO1001124.1 hypothetical protein [Pseudogracilibacillus auburnensis]PXW90556.1 hypothetical protein DFR56_101468 [Pseudogracilibacillus auburnensis]
MYGISVSNDYTREELVSRSKELAIHLLPLPAINNERYGVGFIGVHEGEGASFIFVD